MLTVLGDLHFKVFPKSFFGGTTYDSANTGFPTNNSTGANPYRVVLTRITCVQCNDRCKPMGVSYSEKHL